VEWSIRQSVENVYDIVVHVEPAGKRHDDEPFRLDEKMVTDAESESDIDFLFSTQLRYCSAES
jgi:hypothetical protein